MLVSHRKKFIFMKTVKTAGTSVESYFEKWCMPDGTWEQFHFRDQQISSAGIIGARSTNLADTIWYNHMSCYNMRRLLGPEIWERYLKFTVVRNPYDKLISGFYMFQKDNCLDGDVVDKFRAWLDALGKLFLENKSLVEASDVPHYLKPMELALIDRDKYVLENEECIDCYIRYENLIPDMKIVCDKLNVPFEPSIIPNFKNDTRLRHVPIEEYFDLKSQEIVQELYKWEILRFNYCLSV